MISLLIICKFPMLQILEQRNNGISKVSHEMLTIMRRTFVLETCDKNIEKSYNERHE
jgi:hypothetical protein